MVIRSIFPVGVVLALLLSFTVAGLAESPVPTDPVIERVRASIDSRPQLLEWSTDGTLWTPFTPSKSFGQPTVLVRIRFAVPKVFAGGATRATPLAVRLSLSGRGDIRIYPCVAGKDLAEIPLEGGTGGTVAVTPELVLQESASDESVLLELRIVNRGFLPARGEFWPERMNPLVGDEGAVVRIEGVERLFPAAESRRKTLRAWLDSFDTARTLLRPDLTRFTFTGKPYAIPDRRRTSPAELARLNGAFDRATAALDLVALEEGRWEQAAASIQRSYRLAAPVQKHVAGYHIRLIGNAHIDIAWLWRLAETIQVARNTFATVIQNMLEYPELLYAQSQAQTYEWIETRYPELFEQIRQRVRDGRWEIVGGMWVEPDCNLISGESWVRQILLGKTYFQQKFGVDVTTGWNPDSFGYNWNMPQLYRQSGITRFITQKLWWNDTTVFPHFLFWWQGVDGSRLLTYLPPASYDTSLKLLDTAKGISRYEATTGLRDSLLLWGMGDHGGGPNREVLDRVRGYHRLPIAPQFSHGRAGDFLDRVERLEGGRIPVWNDELYLEYHQGTFTTQGAIKTANRRSEQMAQTAEKAAVTAALLGTSYPAGAMNASWKTLLTNQFHDILPGSSIAPVYRDALEDHARIQSVFERVTVASLTEVAARIDTSTVRGRPLVIFNPLSWPRADLVTVQFTAVPGEFWHIEDSRGGYIPAEIGWNAETGQGEASFVTGTIPALGYEVYALVPGAIPDHGPAVPVDQWTVENAALRLTINPQTGNIASLVDRRTNRILIRPDREGNLLWVYEDRPENWDAWNIGTTGRGWRLDRADSVEVLRSSAVRTTFRVKKSFLGLSKDRSYPTENFPSSFFVQDITVYRDLDRIDIATEADWWEDHLSLKAVFPTTVESERATYEIPFAAIARSARRRTLAEKARYEVPALRWADLSDARGGLSLLNDGKYGHDIHDGVMMLSLLRSPTWPDPQADRGKHRFTYSLYPHSGGWQEGETVHRGAELNAPLRTVWTDAHAGPLPRWQSLATVVAEGGTPSARVGVIVDTLKPAENGSGVSYRLYASLGRAGTVAVELAGAPKSARLTDLLERGGQPLAFTGKRIVLAFKPFEIKTLRVEY